jgi:hypothetical protein
MGRLNDLALLDLRSLVRILTASVDTCKDLKPSEWLGVVELLTMRVVEECDGLSGEQLSMCSVALAQAFEGAVAAGVIDPLELVVRRLNLSAALFQRIAPNSEVDMLNPNNMLELLFGSLPMSVDEARRLSADWRVLDISQIRHLRVVKNLVSPAVNFAQLVTEESLAARLRSWGELLPSLP